MADSVAGTNRFCELSVIIPTRNRASRLIDCMEGIARQTLGHDLFEVIVVDNASTDETRQIVSERQRGSCFPLRYLREDRPGLHNGRHTGMKAAVAGLLVFADDDIVPLPAWLEAVLEGFRQWNPVLLGGRNLPAWEQPPPRWLMDLWNETRRIGTLSILDLGNEVKTIDPNLVWGCNFAVRKSVLLEAGGFHPDAMPQELLRFRGDGESHVTRYISARGYPALYHPGAAVHHSVPASRMTFDYFRQRAHAQGISESFYLARQSGVAALPVGRSRWKEMAATVAGSTIVDSALRHLLPWRRYLSIAMGTAHRSGFTWHQELCLTDQEVREWVFRPGYVDIRRSESLTRRSRRS